MEELNVLAHLREARAKIKDELEKGGLDAQRTELLMKAHSSTYNALLWFQEAERLGRPTEDTHGEPDTPAS